MANVRNFYCDDETGEVITYSVNFETGEPKVESSPPILHIQDHPLKTFSRPKYMKFPRGYMSKTKKFKSLKANILAGSNRLSHRMIMIPAMMIFPSLVCIILMVLELYLHIHCHKKNKKLKDPNLYYRSPFHVLTSTFCGVCRENDSASKISQLQDQRRHRYDYFRGIAI
ncbi:hypothetical protein K1T71_000392 [Dendrolimus kikuchii]|uniref:Uncharacterized protein n=1 Tax=Dendrolimus kikuchii TaxID=765133 RepID=A0ACC1DJR4_9NEOP|nr:hypothetical protein K1T71_000392 [Dendrolimus kikuchii]